MNNLEVRGTQNFKGIEIPVIEGGFGEGQKVILAKTVAEIHEVELRKVNELINNNIDEFEFGVDILDLKNSILSTDSLLKVGFSNQSIANSKNIYLLSEQGYMALVMLMRTEKAKEIRRQLRKEYFAMREVINSDEQLKANLLLQIYNGGQEGILASKQLTELEVKEATKPLLDKIEEDKPLVAFADRVLKDGDNILVRELAKVASDQGYKIGEKKLYKKLREWGYIFKDGTEPKQKYIDNGYFVVESRIVNTPYGSKQVFTTKVSPRGQIHIVERLIAENVA